MTLTGQVRDSARQAGGVLGQAGRAWSEDRASRLGASLAYYSLFALVPVLFLAISVAGLLVGEAVADSAVEARIAEVVSPDVAQQIATAIDEVRAQRENALVPLVALGALVATASVLFVAWRDVVDLVWGVPRTRGLRASLRRHAFGVLMVVSAGAVLALSIFSQIVLGTIESLVDSAALDAVLTVTGSLATGAVGALFVAVLLWFTPDTDVSWRSVWAPALLTVGLLSVGAWGYGLYLGSVGLRSVGGAAGSLFLGLALVYYAAQILLFGVELSKVIERSS